MKEETKLVHEFINKLRFLYPVAHATQIESNYTDQGIFDLNVCFKGREYWIEFKVGDNKLSPLQLSWGEAHSAAGGQCFVFTKISDYYIVDECHFVSVDRAIQYILGEMG